MRAMAKKSGKAKEVRLGVVGIGGMGGVHARMVLDGKVSRCRLTAVCDADAGRLADFDGKALTFTDSRAMVRSGEVDAVLIATPHYAHTTIGIDALEQGMHVLVEKPISVHKADCEKLLAAHRKRRQVFAAMFNTRTDPHYKKVKMLIEDGHLGELMRVNWIITTWYRTEAYFGAGGWRATWKGEGGGVLLNQCPHQLDMLQWLCGIPVKVRGFCGLGKRHDIEVEDEVTAYMEFKNGATGVFITSTGEAPGTNRLEIVGEHGRVVVEDGEVCFTRNEKSAIAFCKDAAGPFDIPDTWNIAIPAEGEGGQHREVMQNFTDAILDRTPLIAPAKEGINSVELANAILMSSLAGKSVDLPINGKAFERRLKKLVKESTFVKKAVKPTGPVDMAASFSRA
jgi:predicted dehydrogenase